MNLLKHFFKEKKICYTHSFLNQLIASYPYHGSLWAYQKILEEYAIPVRSFKLHDKTLYNQLQYPFFAETKNGVVLVEQISANNVNYWLNDKRIRVDFEKFSEQWTGSVLESFPQSDSGEHQYVLHYRKEKMQAFNATLTLVFLLVSLFLWFYFSTNSYPMEVVVQMVWNMLGVVLSLALLLNDLKVPNKVTEKLCSLIPGSQCLHKAKSKEIKILGRFRLSECGLVFFVLNLALLVLNPQEQYEVLSFVISGTLPFTIWSITYQWKVLHRWCVLCLLTMGVLWAQFVGYLLSNVYVSVVCSLSMCFWLMWWFIVFYMMVVLVHNVSRQFVEKKNEKLKHEELMRLKYDKEIFQMYLQQQTKVLQDGENAHISFGDSSTDKPIITIVGNPFCAPCGGMHVRLQALYDRGFTIQYIMTYFSEQLSFINKEVIAYYLKCGADKTWQKLTMWYDSYHTEKSHFEKGLSLDDLQTEAVEAQFKKQKEWVKDNNIDATPLVLVDGYTMPDNYSVEDLYHIY